jgi:hypothetical protein
MAERADDRETAEVALRITYEERAAAARIAGTWDTAIAAALDELTADPAP